MKRIRRGSPPVVTIAALNKAKTMPPHKLGAWWEDQLKDHFTFLQATERFYWHRFPDTKSCGNFVADQPADFLVCSAGSGMLLEAKASAKHDSLRSCLSNNVSGTQALHHRLWARAGGSSMFVFLGVSTDTVEIWDGAYVANHRTEGKVMTASTGRIFMARATSGGTMDALVWRCLQ